MESRDDGIITRARANQQNCQSYQLPNDQNETNTPPSPTPPNDSPVDTNQVLATLMAQNSMLLELLKLQQTKPSNEMTFAPDFNKSIPMFNGLNTGHQALDWLKTVNSIADLNRWPDIFRLQSARSNMIGPASHWLLSRNITNWADFEYQFKKTFVGETTIGDRWKNMVLCIQRKSQNVLEYFHEKVHLCSILELEFSEVKIQVLEGLYSKDLSMHLLGRNHMDADALLNDIINFERLDAARTSRIRQTISTSTSENTSQKSTTPSPRYNQAAPQKGIQNTSTRICFNCGSTSHIASACIKPRIAKGACYECGSTTHQRPKCPKLMQPTTPTLKKGPTTENESKVMNVQSNFNHTSPYEVTCTYEIPVDEDTKCSTTFMAIIDTGSPINLLKCELLPNNVNVIKPVGTDDNFAGINGAKLELLGTFETNVNIDDNIFFLRFFVVPENTMTVSAILGRDFVTKPGVNLSFKNGILHLDCQESESNKDNNFSQILCVSYEYEFDNVREKINVNPDLSSNVKEQLCGLYQKEYVNKPKDNALETNPNLEMKIVLKHDQPIAYRARRISYNDREKLRNILDELLREGVIRESRSPYSSPIVLIRKKNGDTRLCIDYRELNKITIKDNFPSPLIDDQIDSLKTKKYYSLIDLRNGFHHVRMSPSSIPYTSFVTPLGQYEYLKMPFGLTNAPKVFARFMQYIFADLIREGEITLYIDDMLVATATIVEHFSVLEKIFNLASKFDLKFRLDKCTFLYTSIEYLGYIINEFGVRPSPRNIESVKNYPTPKNQKQVRQFIGLASYFRRFIANFSLIAKPLHTLLQKNVDFCFGEDEQCAFNTLKDKLLESPILCIYSPTAITELHCDASSYGYGSVLLQKQSSGKLHPVFYFSQRTTQVESRYHSFELECLAVVYSVKRFHVYLAGMHFKVVTDCNSFRLTLDKQIINPRISRWALFLQNYNFEIVHRPGTRMGHVDALSRCHGILILESNTFEQILAIKQSMDGEIVKIRDKLQLKEDKYFELREGLVYRKERDKLLFYVPQSMENNVIRSCHDDMAHVGLDKVIENVKRVYWFPDIKTKVRDYLSSCLKCIEYSPKSGKREGFLHSIPKGDRPFLTVHVDHLGPFERTENHNKFILVVIDGFTKFVRCYPCKTTKSGEVIKHMTEYFRTYSKPKRLISDRGTAFTSNDFRSFLSNESVEQILIATGTPRANGQVEVVNRSITPMIAKIVERPDEWDQVLSKVEFAINNTIHKATGQTPSKLLFGIEQVGEITDKVRYALDVLSDTDESTEMNNLVKIRETASDRILKTQKNSVSQYNSSRKEPVKYNTNDYVMIKNFDVTPGVNKKLIPKFKGPYTVRKVLDKDRYIVADIDGNQITQRPFEGVVGPDQMRKWVRMPVQ